MTEYARFARDYLREIVNINREIERNQREREKLFNLAQQCGAIITGDRVQTSPSGGKMEQYVIELVELEQQCGNLVKMWLARRAGIIALIEEMEDKRYRAVLQYRYVDGERLQTVAELMHYSVENVKIIHRNALDEFGRLLCHKIDLL